MNPTHFKLDRLRKGKKKPATKDDDWMTKFKVFDGKKEKQRAAAETTTMSQQFSDEEDDGDEELIEHVNLQNSVRTKSWKI
jgi:hypothetical protein